MTIALFGSTGMLGSDFVGEMLRPSREVCNVVDYQSVLRYFNDNDLHVAINCVGMTGEQTEEKKLICHEKNVIAVRNLALACKLHNVRLVHFSSSIAGKGSTYTLTKRYSEQIVEDYLKDYTIVTTGWLFSLHKDKSFMTSVMNKLLIGEPMKVYAEIGSPCYSKDVASYVINNLDTLKHREVIANEGYASRHEWANEIAHILGYNLKIEYGIRRFQTKTNSSLDGQLRHWKKALRACLCDKGYLIRN